MMSNLPTSALYFGLSLGLVLCRICSCPMEVNAGGINDIGTRWTGLHASRNMSERRNLDMTSTL